MPGRTYSTGSSTVMILTEGFFSLWRQEYKVVLLPEPVGPVTRIIPWGCDTICQRFSETSSGIPNEVKEVKGAFDSSNRITTFSPYCVGRAETRRSSWRDPR